MSFDDLAMPLLGGALIGLAAAAYVAFEGRAAGISGMIHGTWERSPDTRPARIAFLVGLAAAAPLGFWIIGLPTAPIDAPVGLLTVAGLAVGAGTRLANGCTSGHGVCGISRGSIRSITATFTFMLVGGVVVWAARTAGGAP